MCVPFLGYAWQQLAYSGDVILEALGKISTCVHVELLGCYGIIIDHQGNIHIAACTASALTLFCTCTYVHTYVCIYYVCMYVVVYEQNSMIYSCLYCLSLATDMSPIEFAAQEEMERQTWKVNIDLYVV